MNSVNKTLAKRTTTKPEVVGNKSATKVLPAVSPIQLANDRNPLNSSIDKSLESYPKTISSDSTIQKKSSSNWSFQTNSIPNSANHPIQKKAAPTNKTGLPDNVKSGVEQLSGLSLSDVKVHYNSSKPAQLQAHAYAKGTDIHVGPGQEKHLPHEAWHVVQQKQGRVNATVQMKNKVAVNDDAGLEKEADVMGAKAIQLVAKEYNPSLNNKTFSNSPIVQKVDFVNRAMKWVGGFFNSSGGSKSEKGDTTKKNEAPSAENQLKEGSLKQKEPSAEPQKKGVDRVALKKEYEKTKLEINIFIEKFNQNKSLAIENLTKHESFDTIFESNVKEVNAAKQKIPKGRLENLKLKYEETKSDKLGSLFNNDKISATEKRFKDAIEKSVIEKELVEKSIEEVRKIDTKESLDDTLIENALAKANEHKLIAESCYKISTEALRKAKIQSNEKVQANKIIEGLKNDIEQIAKEDYEDFKKIKIDTKIAKEKKSSWLPFGNKLTDYDKSLLEKDKKKIKVTEKDPELTEEQKDQISKERNKSLTSRFTRAFGFKTATEKSIDHTNKEEKSKKSVKESSLDELLKPSEYNHAEKRREASEIATKEIKEKEKEKKKIEEEKKKIEEEKKLKQKEWDSKTMGDKASHLFNKASGGATSFFAGLTKGAYALGAGIKNGIYGIGDGIKSGVSGVGSMMNKGAALAGKGIRKLRNKETDADKQENEKALKDKEQKLKDKKEAKEIALKDKEEAKEKALKDKEEAKENLLKTEYALSGNLGKVDSKDTLESKKFVEKSPKIIQSLNWEAMKIPSKYNELLSKEKDKGIVEGIKGFVKPIDEKTKTQQQLGLGAIAIGKGNDSIENADKKSTAYDVKSEEEKQKNLASIAKEEEESYVPLFLELFAIYKIFDELKNLYENKKEKNVQNSVEVVKQITTAAMNGLKISQKIFDCTGQSLAIAVPALGTIIGLAEFTKSYFSRVLAIESGKKMEEMVNHGFDDLPFKNEKIFKQDNRGALTQYQNFNRIKPEVLKSFDDILHERNIPIHDFNKTYGTSEQIKTLDDLKKFISRLRGYELISKLHEINLKRNIHSNVNLFADTAMLGAKISELIPGGQIAAGIFYTIGGGTKALTKAAVTINKIRNNKNGNAEAKEDRTNLDYFTGIFKESPIKHAEYVNHAFKIIEMYSAIVPNLHDDEKFEKNINTVEGIVVAAGAYPPAVYKSAKETSEGYKAVDKLIDAMKSGR